MKLKTVLLCLFSFITVIFASSTYAMDSMQMDASGTGGNMLMTATFQLTENDIPLDDATVILGHQSRVSDRKGIVQFEDVMSGRHTVRVIYQGKEQEVTIDVKEDTNLVKIDNNNWKDLSFDVAPVQTEQSQAQNLLVTMITVLLCFGAAMVLIKKRHLLVPDKSSKKRKVRRSIIGTFLVFGLISASILTYQMIGIAKNGTQAFVHSTMAAEVDTLPKPANVKAYGDDNVATISWDAPANADSLKIVGYFVRWGLKENGVLTDSKTTIYTQTQIQPLLDNKEYIVTVQSVTGEKVNSVTRTEKNEKGETVTVTYQGEYVDASKGNISTPVQTSVKETSARVDAMRSRLTGFFDDFNLPAGNFDETKWNTAYTGCTEPSTGGAFINSQLHAHNQLKSRFDGDPSGLPYCDRAATASRPRAVFDVSGATEANPAIIEMDVDGAVRNRDIWYIDLIPLTARTNGIPIDLEAHDEFFQSDTQEPGSMFRITHTNSAISMNYWDEQRKPGSPDTVFSCQGWLDGKASFEWCGINQDKVKTTKYSPIPEDDRIYEAIPNVRRHWVIEYSPTVITVFINGIKIYSAKTPAFIANTKKFQVTSELFAYTTGKDYEWTSPKIKPTTTIMHWDNFGFSGPAPATVVHNYIDGGPTGANPLLGTGFINNPIPRGNRTTKVNIPDDVAGARQARIMFTLNPLGNATYTWSSSQSVTVNGKKFVFPNPNTNIPAPAMNPIAASYTPHSTGIIIPAADIQAGVLKKGMNDVQFALDSDITNMHIEVEFTKGTEPQYTQPQNVFTGVNYTSLLTPKNKFNDSYLFIEQDMGLVINPGTPQPTTSVVPTAQATATPRPTVIPSSTPRPTTGPSATPFPTVTRAPTAVPTATPLVQASPTPRPTTVVPTAVPPTGGTLGYTQIGSSTDSNDSNYINSSRFKMGSVPKVVKSMSVYVATVGSAPNNQFQVGIYTDKNGKPDKLVARSQSATLTANSWNTVAITANLEAGKNYWLAYNTNGVSGGFNNMKFSSGGKDAYTTSSTKFGTWPQTFGGSTVGTFKFSIYATFQ